MSVINAVLRDLDDKPSVFVPLETVDLVVPNTLRRKTFSRFAVIGLVLLVLLVAVYLWQSAHRTLESKVNEPLSVSENMADEVPDLKQGFPAAEITASDKITENQNITPLQDVNRINGLQLHEKSHLLELEFEFSRKANSFLVEKNENHYVFRIRDTLADIDTPLISGNPWLENFELVSEHTDIDVIFKTRPGMLVETHEVYGADKYLWLIRLKQPEIERKPVNSPRPVVKPVSNNPVVPAVKPDQPKPAKVADNTVSASVNVRLDIKPTKKKMTDRERLNEAMLEVSNNRLIEAEHGLQALLGGEVDRQARLQLLNLLQRQHKDSEYEDLLTESLRKYPQQSALLLMDANRLFAGKQYQQLASRFAVFDSDVRLLNLVGASHQRLGEHERAIDSFAKALELDPSLYKVWVSLAISQQQLGHNQDAVHAYKMALQSGRLSELLQSFVKQRIRQLNQ
jgi:hypothetical protein